MSDALLVVDNGCLKMVLLPLFVGQQGVSSSASCEAFRFPSHGSVQRASSSAGNALCFPKQMVHDYDLLVWIIMRETTNFSGTCFHRPIYPPPLQANPPPPKLAPPPGCAAGANFNCLGEKVYCPRRSNARQWPPRRRSLRA
jgi:hypothetical protein